MFKTRLSPQICGILLALVIGGGLYFRAHFTTASPAKPETVVEAVPLIKQNTSLTHRYIGYVQPIHSVAVMPNITGYVDEVWAQGGTSVKAGDNLVLIDQREYKAELEAAQAATAQAQATYNNALSYYNRAKKAGAKAVAAADLDSAKAQYLSAKASLAQAQADEHKAEVLYNYTVLQAPIDGVIGDVSLTKGDYITPSAESLFDIIQFDPIRVVFALSDKEYLQALQKHSASELLKESTIQLQLADGKIYDHNGEFRFCDNQLDKSTSSVSVFADFANPDKRLLTNSYVDVLVKQPLQNVYVIDRKYASLTNDGVFVDVVNHNHLRREKLQILGYDDNRYAVDNNFRKDDFLVITPIENATSGLVVQTKIVQPAEAK
jgi:RND family efflux transporter MFP subunit